MSRFFSTQDAPQYIRSPVLYERKAVTDLWNRLTVVTRQQWKWKNLPYKEDLDFVECLQRILQIYGPPGSGKSIASFYWARHVCETCHTRAYWISCAAENQKCWSIGVIDDGGRALINEHAMPQTTGDLLDASIVVFDGIRAALLETWRGMMNDLAREGIAVIVVSSEGVQFHDGDSSDIMKLHHILPSWTLDEYFGACNNDEFWKTYHLKFQSGTPNDNENRRKQLITNKFVAAGHSARFMFKYFESVCKQKIVTDVEAMGGIESLEQAVRNTRSSGAVNTVIARLQADKNGTTPQEVAEMPIIGDLTSSGVSPADFNVLDAELDPGRPQTRLVSTLASEEVCKNIPSSIARLRRLANVLSNKAIEGYAFEEQLKKSLREAANPGHSLHLLDKDRRNVELSVDSFVLCGASELVETLGACCKTLNTWIFVGGQQGAFDAVHVVSATHLRFTQCTVELTHTFYLDVVDQLIRDLSGVHAWTHVEFLVLRAETERPRKFALKPGRGGLQPFLRFDEVQWDRRDYRKNVQYLFLEWTEG